jgi:hypothetical protein
MVTLIEPISESGKKSTARVGKYYDVLRGLGCALAYYTQK